MKKILVALLAGLTIFAFAACGDKDDADSKDNDTRTEDVATDGSLNTETDEPRYTSDGELIVEEELPASDGTLTE